MSPRAGRGGHIPGKVLPEGELLKETIKDVGGWKTAKKILIEDSPQKINHALDMIQDFPPIRLNQNMYITVLVRGEIFQQVAAMKYRNVGKSGLKVSEIAIGAWLTFGGKLNIKASHACLKEAVEQGINFIDVADVYARGKAEEVVGQFIKDYDRKDFVISSKVFWPMSDNVNDRGLSRKHIMESVDGSLKRLGTDYLDIYYCHRFDWNTPLEETVLTMGHLIEEGKILYWGTSVWEAHLIERAIGIAKELGVPPPVVEQPRYNMLDRYIELHVLETARYNGLGITPWSPLYYGILTGKYNEGIPEDSRASWDEFTRSVITEETIEKVRKLTEIAKELDITMSQLALAWILRLPEISAAITGATKPEHVRTNAGASGITIPQEALDRIETILQNKPEYHRPYRPILDL